MALKGDRKSKWKEPLRPITIERERDRAIKKRGKELTTKIKKDGPIPKGPIFPFENWLFSKLDLLKLDL